MCTLGKEGYSRHKIAEKIGVSCKGVRYTPKRKDATKLNPDRKRSGRPKSKTKSEGKFGVMLSKRNQRLIRRQIANTLNETRGKTI